MIEIIDNFFSTDDLTVLISEVEKGQWHPHGYTVTKPYNPIFWFKDIINTKATSLFTSIIQRGIGHKIIIDRLYVNGQAHGQCGDWHTDFKPMSSNCFTLVHFFKDWQPEYGGHLLIRTSPVTSVLPEFNKAVLFDSTIEHMGMEPTTHCKTQRESIACKFRVL